MECDPATRPRGSGDRRRANRSKLRCGAACQARQPAMKADVFEIDGLHAVADRFDHVLLDQWGTLHDGRAVFAPARDCVTRLRESGKRVLVLSNSGKRARLNAGRLSNLGLTPDTYDGMLTSGELTWAGLRERICKPFTDLGEACYLITRGDDN